MAGHTAHLVSTGVQNKKKVGGTINNAYRSDPSEQATMMRHEVFTVAKPFQLFSIHQLHVFADEALRSFCKKKKKKQEINKSQEKKVLISTELKKQNNTTYCK